MRLSRSSSDVLEWPGIGIPSQCCILGEWSEESPVLRPIGQAIVLLQQNAIVWTAYIQFLLQSFVRGSG